MPIRCASVSRAARVNATFCSSSTNKRRANGAANGPTAEQSVNWPPERKRFTFATPHSPTAVSPNNARATCCALAVDLLYGSFFEAIVSTIPVTHRAFYAIQWWMQAAFKSNQGGNSGGGDLEDNLPLDSCYSFIVW